ncbi:putative Rieske 2Fe-2S iron-sulfur protein [Pilimelia terevasa]|uniref:Putative Rieske 2Fe-2S iron-sulfur protein n=1 Tax=Pilimelia terevasa TaxID=53372 RepID=A0A8J3BK14_9ACTN|nr:Rieske 2Fe-2S domain-containing protein [Pilimelia terevasa]GGK16343.1 putative Rieske 2Fe-2S iron-sulfur protein [Pilimelia terevasa]
MKITFLGHAGVHIAAGATRLVCDPWFSAHGAFLGGWHPLPDNGDCAPLVDDATHVYVSHGHEDHLDRDVLASLPAGVPVFLPHFRRPGWRRLLRALGRGLDVQPLVDGAVVEAGQLRLRLVLSPTARHEDSALVVEDRVTGLVAVNLNDCQLDADQLRAIRAAYPRVDVALSQYSGATWFPFAYDFPVADRVAAAAQKKMNSMRRWHRAMSILQPNTAIAFAGPPMPLDPALTPFFFGPDSIFTTPSELRDWLDATDPDLSRRCHIPMPGDVLDLDGEVFVPDPDGPRLDWADLNAYVTEYAKRRAPAIEAQLAALPSPTPDLFARFAGHFGRLFVAAPSVCRGVDALVAFDITGAHGGCWLVDFRRLEVTASSDGFGDAGTRPDYRFGIDSRFLPTILSGGMSFEDFFFSFRFRASRPSIGAYNEELMSVLRFSNPADLVFYGRSLDQEQQPTSSFRLCTPLGTYDVPDRCPHNGARLGPEDYQPGDHTVVCGQHGWRFRLPSGECLNGRATLAVREVTAASEPDSVITKTS